MGNNGFTGSGITFEEGTLSSLGIDPVEAQRLEGASLESLMGKDKKKKNEKESAGKNPGNPNHR